MMRDSGIMNREAADWDRRGNALIIYKHRRPERSLVMEQVQQLLPGITDDITIEVIATKLPWTDLRKLSTVSCGWQRAIWSHQVHDARVRSQSTQTVVVMKRKLSNVVSTLTLFSLRDDSFHSLPKFSRLDLNHGELPRRCQCVSLDGKVYVLGGELQMIGLGKACQSSAAVIVLDLAGQGKWKQCASMQDPRSWFACGVINGKIYVFGGRRASTPDLLYDIVKGCEVYDPKLDTWSPIAPTRYHGSHQNVVTIGEELFVYASEHYYPWFHDPRDPSRPTWSPMAEVYHPHRNQWRILDQFTNKCYRTLLVAGGKLLGLSMNDHIDVYDISSNSWKLSQSLSLGMVTKITVPGAADDLLMTQLHTVVTSENDHLVVKAADGPMLAIVTLFAVAAVDDELLALVGSINMTRPSGDVGIWLLRSHGFQDKEIVWQKTRSMSCRYAVLCTIQL